MVDNKAFEPLMDIENILPILHKISIFAGIREKQLYSLFRMLDKVTYKRGECIFLQGHQPSHIYIIQQGSVKLVVEEDDTHYELVQFEEGDCFGEASVIGILPHRATAIATEETHLIVLSRQALLSIYKNDLDLFCTLILNIAREVCRRLHASDEILLQYVHKK
jgi:CRP-like cAMP-binding protein